MTNNIEYRAMDIQPDNNEMMVHGYASLFNSPTVIYTDDNGTEYKEVFDAGAFLGTDLNDVVFRYNHNDSDLIMARTSNDTLALNVDEKGLYMIADIAPTTQGKDLYILIERKDVNKMSLGFIVDKDNYDYDTHTRHIQHVKKVVDVSAVDMPAYPDTSIEVLKRNIQSAEQEYKQKTDQYKRLYIMTML